MTSCVNECCTVIYNEKQHAAVWKRKHVLSFCAYISFSLSLSDSCRCCERKCWTSSCWLTLEQVMNMSREFGFTNLSVCLLANIYTSWVLLFYKRKNGDSS